MNHLKQRMKLAETDLYLCTMGILNLIIVCYVSLFPAVTQMRAAKVDALSFVHTLQSMPIPPGHKVYLSVGIYVLIVFCIIWKRKYYQEKEELFFWISFYEIILTAGLLILLDMSYNGIIFLIVAEFFYYMGSQKNWIGFLVTSFVIYLVCNHNLVSILLPFNSFEVWASFYAPAMRGYILGFKSVCEIVNIMLFLVYVCLLMLRDKEEKRQIKELNARLHQANLDLKDANEQLHQYALEKEQMGEMKERNRLAREIHDTLGHILTGISVGVEAVQVLQDIAPDAAKERLGTIGDMARNGLQDVRRSVRKLKPDALEANSLSHAIQQMLSGMMKTTGAKLYFVCYGKTIPYGPDEKETIFRMIQEGTTNALRHGKATEVWIRLDQSEDSVEVTIRDNGCGCSQVTEGFGLTHMKERVQMLGGHISFDGSEGFHIAATIPVRWQETGVIEENEDEMV